MRLILTLMSALFFMNASGAEITIFNMSTLHSMEITYKNCLNGTLKGCSANETLILQSSNQNNSKNYATITIPDEQADGTTAGLVILTAYAKDESGKIVSQGVFTNGTDLGCLTAYDYPKKNWIILNDMNGSPYILCFIHRSYW